jgi:hypothetical protein
MIDTVSVWGTVKCERKDPDSRRDGKELRWIRNA